jgi:hypothetical protein
MIIGTIDIKQAVLLDSVNKVLSGKLHKEFWIGCVGGNFKAYSCDVDILNKYYTHGSEYNLKLNVTNDGTFFIEKIQEIAEQQKLF